MPTDRNPTSYVVCLAWLLAAGVLSSGCGERSPARREIRVAVASNFRVTMAALARRYEAKQNGRMRIKLSAASTGKLRAQIANGAPFDLFFAADATRPRSLETEGLTVSGTRFTYALGRLVLYSPKAVFVEAAGEVLVGAGYRHLAMANPTTAPYGRAAQQALEALGVWDWCEAKVVRGENVGQAMQFVRSGNAELGVVAKSQVLALADGEPAWHWDIPQALHEAIEQQVVLLREVALARGFLEFVRSEEGRSIIRSHGYGTP